MKMASASAHGTRVEHPFAYLGTCLSSVICDEARESKTEIVAVALADHDIQDRTDQFERLATADAVRFTLSELTAVQRAVLLSHGAYEMTFEQIARELGCSPATAYRLWRRARAAFAMAYSRATGECKTPNRAESPPQPPSGGRLRLGEVAGPAPLQPQRSSLLRKAA
jgi:DNA-directed RNA polymerase specialized sigma24 family protein